jgi:hypothetical protein
MKSLFGFGGVKFEKNDRAIEFPYDFGNITPSPVFSARRENINRRLVGRQLGFRNNISIRLYSRSDEDAESFRDLAIMLNTLTNEVAQETIIVYPRYDSTAGVTNQSYECILNSDFNVADLANVPVGQSITINFVAVELLPISTVITGSAPDNWIDENDNNIVDENGNNLIFKDD